MMAQYFAWAKIFNIKVITTFIVIVLSFIGIWADCVTITPTLVHRLPFLKEVCSPPKETNHKEEDVNEPDVNEPDESEPIIVQETGMVRATGIGFPLPDAENSTLKYETAKRAAELDAQRKLAEYIKKVIVEANTKTKNKRFFEEEVESRVNTSLRLSRRVSVSKNSDDSVTVVMEAPLEQ